MSVKSLRFLLIFSVVLCSGFTFAQCPSTPTAARFVVSGGEVTDRLTGLVWARCSVGQNWDGSICAGDAIRLTHESALNFAKSTDGWRLPNIKELFSLIDPGCSSFQKYIDGQAFPNTMFYYWSSTPVVGRSEAARFVSFTSNGNDQTHTSYRYAELYVRLVRVGN